MISTIIDYLLCYMNAFLFGVFVGIGIVLFVNYQEGQQHEQRD